MITITIITIITHYHNNYYHHHTLSTKLLPLSSITITIIAIITHHHQHHYQAIFSMRAQELCFQEILYVPGNRKEF